MGVALYFQYYRQRNEEYRRGISDCALGRFEAAFERFDANGFIHEGKSKYLDQAAARSPLWGL